MFRRKLCTGSAALTCLAAFQIANAAPAYQILYHERLEIAPRVDAQGQQHLGFDAYGRHFDLNLESNESIRRGVPASRSDIKPYRGTVAGRSGSWVRLTQTRDGWHGVLSDGQDLYAIEPASQLQQAGVQSVTGEGTSPVMYRLADTLMPDGAGYCGTDTNESLTQSSRATAQSAYTAIAKDLAMKSSSVVTTQQLVVSIVTDHWFADQLSDPAGEIVSRMDVVDGIWSSQVGIHIALGTINIVSDTDDPFSTTTVPTDLLAEVATYRGKLPGSDSSGLTHLMSARTLDGNIVGIAYVGAVCDGSNSVSLSDTTVSTTMGALVAAHELGHNFNSPHDGVSGSACASTPQTYLMAPQINFSNQFSACSLTQITARAASASCLQPVGSSGGGSGSGATSSGGTSGTVSDPGGSAPSGSSGGGGGGSLNLTWLAFLASLLMLRGARRQRAPR